jgi:hypothetical protein
VAIASAMGAGAAKVAKYFEAFGAARRNIAAPAASEARAPAAPASLGEEMPALQRAVAARSTDAAPTHTPAPIAMLRLPRGPECPRLAVHSGAAYRLPWSRGPRVPAGSAPGISDSRRAALAPPARSFHKDVSRSESCQGPRQIRPKTCIPSHFNRLSGVPRAKNRALGPWKRSHAISRLSTAPAQFPAAVLIVSQILL